MFEKLKQSLLKKIEENSVKSEMSWTDREGEEHTEIVYLKRGKGRFGNWHQAYLPIKEETNKWDLRNAIFGGKRNLLILIIYLLIIALFFLAYFEISGQYTYLRNLSCVQNCIENLRVIP